MVWLSWWQKLFLYPLFCPWLLPSLFSAAVLWVLSLTTDTCYSRWGLQLSDRHQDQGLWIPAQQILHIGMQELMVSLLFKECRLCRTSLCFCVVIDLCFCVDIEVAVQCMDYQGTSLSEFCRQSPNLCLTVICCQLLLMGHLQSRRAECHGQCSVSSQGIIS